MLQIQQGTSLERGALPAVLDATAGRWFRFCGDTTSRESTWAEGSGAIRSHGRRAYPTCDDAGRYRPVYQRTDGPGRV